MPTLTQSSNSVLQAPDYAMTMIAAVIGLAIIIIIGFAVTLLMLRKK